MGKFQNLENMIFGNWKVLYRSENKINNNKKPVTMWRCECLLCGNQYDVSAKSLKLGNSKQCLQCSRKNRKIKKRKSNKFIQEGDFFIGILNNNNKFYIDLDDYEKVSKFYWRETENGYAYTKVNKQMFFMHRYILEDELKNYNDKMDVDHINHNKLDNRKHNLRIVNRTQNNMNRKATNPYNTNGIYFSNTFNKYVARITIYNKVIPLGCYEKLEDAIKARKEAEKIYYGDFSYDASMRNALKKEE